MKRAKPAAAVLLSGTLAALTFAASSPGAAQGIRSRQGLPSSLSRGPASPSPGSPSALENTRRLPDRLGTSDTLRGNERGFGSVPSGFERARPGQNSGDISLSPWGIPRTDSGTLPPKEQPRYKVQLPAPTPSVSLPPKRVPRQARPGLPQSLPSWNHSGAFYTAPGTVIRLSDYGVTIFSGYGTVYAPGRTFLSPFLIYNCPPYISASHVVTAPYLYIGGREIGSFSPLTYGDRYGATDAYRARALRAALNDLTRFWEENDTRALRRRVSSDFAVAIFQEERHLYSLRPADFLALAGDALDRVTTLSLRFDTIRDRTDGLVNAYGTHVYRLRGDGTPRVATTRYTLVYVDGDWYISAVALAPDLSRESF